MSHSDATVVQKPESILIKSKYIKNSFKKNYKNAMIIEKI